MKSVPDIPPQGTNGTVKLGQFKESVFIKRQTKKEQMGVREPQVMVWEFWASRSRWGSPGASRDLRRK